MKIDYAFQYLLEYICQEVPFLNRIHTAMRLFLPLLFLGSALLVSAKEYNITHFGAVGDSLTDNTKAIQQAIDACCQTAGSVIVPEGVFLSGTIFLKSNVTLRIEKGGVLRAINNAEAFPLIPPGKKAISRMDFQPWKAFIYAYNEENIKITGEGTIYGGGNYEIFQDHIYNSSKRPYGIHLVSCRNIEVSDIFLTNSAFWMMRLNYCDHIVIDNVTIFNHSNINNDGIDIDCSQFVRVSNCRIDASDDALCFKAEGPRTTSDVVVTNCILSSFASAFKLGTGSAGNFERFAVSNLIIRPSESKIIHHEFHARGGLAGIDLASVDGGKLENIVFSNIVIDSVETPLFIRLGMRHDRPYESEEFQGSGKVQNLKFSNIVAYNSGKIACSITGYENNPAQNISLSNIDFHFAGGGTLEDAMQEVPNRARSYPVNRMFNGNLPAYGMYIRNAEDVSLTNINFFLMNPDQRHALVLENVDDFLLKDYRMDKTLNDLALIKVINSRNIRIVGQNGIEDIEKLIRVEGDSSACIILQETPFDFLKKSEAPLNFRVDTGLDKVSYNQLTWDKTQPDGNISYFSIYRNGEPVARTRETQYIDMNIRDNTNYTYSIEAINGQGIFSKKAEASIKSASDKVAPELIAFRLVDNETLALTFSEPVEETSYTPDENFTFTPHLEVLQVMKGENNTLFLKVTPVKTAINYNLTVSDITDQALKGNAMKPFTVNFIDDPLMLSVDFDDLNHLKANHVELREGIKDKAGYFNGTDSYILMGNEPQMNVSGDMSISVWFKLDDVKRDSYFRILSKRNVWNAPDGYEFEINPLQSRINITGGSIGAEDQGVVKYVFDDEWHHLVAMIKDSKALLYIDGEYYASDDYVAFPAKNNTDLVIGATPNLSDVFLGMMDELYLFNRAVSEQEIVALFKLNYYK